MNADEVEKKIPGAKLLAWGILLSIAGSICGLIAFLVLGYLLFFK